MITLGCEHADTGPVLIVTGERNGLDEARASLVKVYGWSSGRVLTCESFAGMLPRHWYEEVAALREAGHVTFLCTAHPGVVDCLHFESAADVRRRILRWRGGQLERLSEDEAERIYGSFERGIQYVSEILACAGLYECACPHEEVREELSGYRACAKCGERVQG